MKFRILLLFFLLSFGLQAQDADSLFKMSIEELLSITIDVGSRAEAKSSFHSLVPVEVISASEIKASGFSDLGMVIQRMIPASQYLQPVLMDGADHVFPLSMRGFSADQVLVLINGKRRNQTALVFENSRINKGAAAVDFRSIPINSVERVEILKDGATAQYGSDAIAGIINIILKEETEVSASLNFGAAYEGDGSFREFLTGFGKKFNYGTVQFYANYRDKSFVDRAGKDERMQYFEGDPRNTGVPVKNHRYGLASSTDFDLQFNASLDLGSQNSFYIVGMRNQRDGESTGYFRRPLDSRNVRAIYPDGFLPEIKPILTNLSGGFGLKGNLSNWETDISVLYGSNNMDYYVNNSLNTSMGIQSPGSFYCGRQFLSQSTINIDLKREINIGSYKPLSFAFGAEMRNEIFEVEKGDENSYKNGGVLVLDGPDAGKAASIGAQVLPGFMPSNEIVRSRSNAAIYLDLENQFYSFISFGLAGRAEKYSDFGPTLDGKFSFRLEMLRKLAFRGSVSSGFRAPSLAQSYYSSTVTNFIDGEPYENGTFIVDHPLSRQMGAKPLKPEKSFHHSAGLAFQPNKGFQFTCDFYYTRIYDRIIFSGNFTADNAPAFAPLFEEYKVGGARFFTNCVNTITQGVDVSVKYNLSLGKKTNMKLYSGFNYNKTRMDGDLNVTDGLVAYQDILFDRFEKARLTKSIPDFKWIIGGEILYRKISWSIHGMYHSPIGVVYSVSKPETDQEISVGMIFDTRISYRINERMDFSFGARNLLNKYPEKSHFIDGDAFTGKIFPYNPFVPYGFAGGEYFFNLHYLF